MITKKYFSAKETLSGRQTNGLKSYHFTFLCACSGANLTILQVRKEDRGRYVNSQNFFFQVLNFIFFRYICEANNGIGETVSRSVSLEVSFGPIISSKRPRVGQKEGYEAELICIVSAYPPAAVSWFRDGKSINSDDHYQLSYLGKPNEETISTLKLKNVQSSLFGRYVCQGTNAYGAGETAMELFGKQTFSFISSKQRLLCATYLLLESTCCTLFRTLAHLNLYADKVHAMFFFV